MHHSLHRPPRAVFVGIVPRIKHMKYISALNDAARKYKQVLLVRLSAGNRFAAFFKRTEIFGFQQIPGDALPAMLIISEIVQVIQVKCSAVKKRNDIAGSGISLTVKNFLFHTKNNLTDHCLPKLTSGQKCAILLAEKHG